MVERFTPKLGALVEGEARRDAVHMAVAPVVAGEHLHAGQHVGLLDDGTASWLVPSPIGIVDPFLAGGVRKGEKFWLFLYPNTVTDLRHAWSHPAFKAKFTR